MPKCILFGYLLLLRAPQISVVSMLGCSASTVTALLGFCRQLAADNLNEKDFVIGGEGIMAEVDEYKTWKAET